MDAIRDAALGKATPIQLGYVSGLSVSGRFRGWSIAATVAMAIGMIVTVVPFTFGVSPAYAMIEETPRWFERGGSWVDDRGIWLLAFPFFLAYPLFGCAIRSVLNLAPGRLERRAVTAIGLTGTVVVGATLVAGLRGSASASDFNVFAIGAGVLLLGLAAVGRALFRRDQDFSPAVLLAAPYAADLTICLVGFWDNAGVGWYLALVPAVAALVMLVVAHIPMVRSRPPRVISPGAD